MAITGHQKAGSTISQEDIANLGYVKMPDYVGGNFAERIGKGLGKTSS